MNNDLKEKFQEQLAEDFKQSKRKQKFKLIMAILFSNLLLFILMASANPNNNSCQAEHNNLSPKHPHHVAIKLSLEVHIPIEDINSEYSVSIYDDNLNLLVARAYLSSLPNSEEVGDSYDTNNEGPFYRLEIPTTALLPVINNTKGKLHAYPPEMANNINRLPSLPTTQVSTYEIIF